MNKIAIIALTVLPIAVQAKAAAPAKTALTGSYRSGNPNARGQSGTLDVQALPGGKVKFQLNAVNAFNPKNGGVNIGDDSGTLVLHSGSAVYHAEKPETGCLLFHFTPKQVTITQKGDMGYGMDVDATGVYKKVSSRPHFDPPI